MVAHPVTESGSLTCSHAGVRKLTGAGAGKLTVEGVKVVLLGAATGPGTYVGCVFKPDGSAPCTSTTTVPGESVVRLTVGGKPVLLDSAALQAGTPAPATSVTISAGQATLTTS